MTNSFQALYERPMLVIDPGKHIDTIRSMARDVKGHWVVTGSDDKTVRVWSLVDSSLFRTIRLPAGPGNIGKAYAVSVSPDGELIAVGGWTRFSPTDPQENIYLYERQSGRSVRCIQGLPETVCHLVFSYDGNYLAAVGNFGLRIYEGDNGWSEVASDEKYDAPSYGVDFTDDGRLATTSLDGTVRLYSGRFSGSLEPTLITRVMCNGQPHGVAFSTNDNGSRLAVGFGNRTEVEIRDGYSLTLLKEYSTYVGLSDITSMKDLHTDREQMLSYGSLPVVAWSSDGKMVFAAGKTSLDPQPVYCWHEDSIKPYYITMNFSDMQVTSLNVLPNGDLLVAGSDGRLERFRNAGSNHFWEGWSISANPLVSFPYLKHKITPDYQDDEAFEEFLLTDRLIQVSEKGDIIDFLVAEIDEDETWFMRFDINNLKLTIDPGSDGKTLATQLRTVGRRKRKVDIGKMRIDNWNQVSIPPFFILDQEMDVSDDFILNVNGHGIKFETPDKTICVAACSDSDRFVVGCEFSIRSYTSVGILKWKHDTPATLSVNVTGDSKIVVAVFSDSTIRWFRIKDGQQLLAFAMLSNNADWIAWTPQGFYGASSRAYNILRWHINRGWSESADSIPIHNIPGSFRPVILPLVLQELEVPRAIGLAVLAENNRQILLRTNSQLPAGIQLHLLAIGISNYREKLKLEYADRDAHDFATIILNTQEGSLYSKVNPMVLLNTEASRRGIELALTSLERLIEQEGTKDDLAIVYFSGHGAMIEDEYFLLPYDIDNVDIDAIRSTGLPVINFRNRIEKLARQCHVLILLDTCYSGSVMNSQHLSAILVNENIAVLASSSSSQISREDSQWQHGIFTKALLDAFKADRGADLDHNGLISLTELADFVSKNVSFHSAGQQSVGMEIRQDLAIFASSV